MIWDALLLLAALIGYLCTTEEVTLNFLPVTIAHADMQRKELMNKPKGLLCFT